jgi:hypothetical protein
MTLETLTEDPPELQSRRSRFAAIVGIAAAVAIGAFLVVRSGNDGPAPDNVTSSSLHDVSFELTWPDLQGLESPDCLETDTTYAWARDDRCFRRFSGETTLTGDVSGTALWMMLGNVGEGADAQDSAVKIPSTFTGTYLVRATVDGCGTGEFMITEQLRFDGWESGAFSGTWHVVPGSGRGDLSTIEGSGEAPGVNEGRDTTQATRLGQLGCE